MFLAPTSLASIMTVIRWIRVIRIIARGRVWRIIFSVFTTLFLIFTFLPFLFWIWRRRIWRIRWRRIRVWGHIWFMSSFDLSRNIENRFRSSCFYSSRNIENRFRSSRFYSSRNFFRVLPNFRALSNSVCQFESNCFLCFTALFCLALTFILFLSPNH